MFYTSQSCNSGRAFRVRPGSGLTLWKSKCFQAISGLHTKLFYNIHSNVFFFCDVQLLCSTAVEVIVILLQLILFANIAAFFCSPLGLVSHSFWAGEQGGEIRTTWPCFKNINHLHDSTIRLSTPIQSCKSDQAFLVRPGSGLSLSKCFGSPCTSFL